MLELLPRHLGVGVKFAAELLALGIRMTLHIRPGHILVSINIKNAYNTMRRAIHSRETQRAHDVDEGSAVLESEAGTEVSNMGRGFHTVGGR